MAVGFNIPNGAFRLSGEEAGGGPNYVKSLREGFQGAADVYKPRTASEGLLAKMLENKMNKPKAEGAQLAFDTDIGYKQALTNQANRPAAVSGEIPLLFQLRNSLPAGPDRDRVDQMITRKSEGTNGMQLTIDPDTHAVSFSQGGSARSGGGSMQTVDANGNPIIVRQPTGAANTASQISGSAQAARNEVEPLATMPYLGGGAEIKLGMDYLAAQNGDQAAKDRLIQAAATDMLAHDMAINQLKSSKANVTNVSTALQMKALKKGWARGTDLVLNNLPPDDQAKAQKLYKQQLDVMNAAQDKYVAQGSPIQVGNKNPTPATIQAEKMKDESTAKQFNTTPMKVLQARSEGVKTAQQFRDWLRSHP